MSRLQDRLARCSNSFYPVLVTNFTSWADPVRQENPQQTKGPPTSGEYINNFDSVKHILIIFQGIFCSHSVDFTCTCGKQLPSILAHGIGPVLFCGDFCIYLHAWTREKAVDAAGNSLRNRDDFHDRGPVFLERVRTTQATTIARMSWRTAPRSTTTFDAIAR